MTFNTGNTKGSDHCFIGDLGTAWGKSHLTGCIGEIILYIHEYVIKWGIKD